jgi:predicted dehydrogenase
LGADARPARLRVGLIGARHWHVTNYLPPLLDLPDVSVVAVADPNPGVAARLADEIGCESAIDFRDVCRPDRVDFVFALGRHCDMADQGRHLLDVGLPFAMEKPCGLDAGEVGDLVARADATGAFAAVPFVWRQTDFMDILRDVAGGDRFEYLSLRIVSGHPDRYVKSGNAWMLDPALAGGGSTLNLGVHLIDLLRELTGRGDIEVTAAAMSNAAFGLPIEDWSALVLRSGAASATVETGFLYPAPTGSYDVQFTIKTDRHYVFSGPESTSVLDLDGGRATRPTRPANEPAYATFVQDALDRYRRGIPPLASLADMRAVIAVIDRAYEMAGPLPASVEPGRAWQPG